MFRFSDDVESPIGSRSFPWEGLTGHLLSTLLFPSEDSARTRLAVMERQERIASAWQYLASSGHNNDGLLELCRYFGIAQKVKLLDGKWRKRTRGELREELRRLLDTSAVQPGGAEDSSTFRSSAVASEQVGDGADVRGVKELAHWRAAREWEPKDSVDGEGSAGAFQPGEAVGQSLKRPRNEAGQSAVDASAVQPGGTQDCCASGSSTVASEQVGDGAVVHDVEPLSHWRAARGFEARDNVDGEESAGAFQPGGDVDQPQKRFRNEAGQRAVPQSPGGAGEDDIEFSSVSSGSEDEGDFVKGMTDSMSESIQWMRSCWRTDFLAARARRFMRQSAKHLRMKKNEREVANNHWYHISNTICRGAKWQTRRDAFRTKAAAVLRALHAEGMVTSGEVLRNIAALSEARGERAKALRDHGIRLRDPTLSVKSLRRLSKDMGMFQQRKHGGRKQLHAEVRATWQQQVTAFFRVCSGAVHARRRKSGKR